MEFPGLLLPVLLFLPVVVAVACGLLVYYRQAKAGQRTAAAMSASMSACISAQFRWMLGGYVVAMLLAALWAVLSDNTQASLLFFVVVPLGMAIGEAIGTLRWIKQQG